jgi:hypothetical protein
MAGWLQIGRENYWIRQAWDPPFTCSSFRRCVSRGELRQAADRLQVAARHRARLRGPVPHQPDRRRRLTIRHGFAFESISWALVIEHRGFGKLIDAILTATPGQCKNLTYMAAATATATTCAASPDPSATARCPRARHTEPSLAQPRPAQAPIQPAGLTTPSDRTARSK